jgi:predicted transcriptional regulator
MTFQPSLQKYFSYLKELKIAEEESNFKRKLYICLEIIPYLPSALKEIEKKTNIKIKDLTPLYYACNCLSVLQEKEELKSICRIVDKIPLPRKTKEEILLSIDNRKLTKKIINNIKEKPGISVKELNNFLNINIEILNKLLNYAKQMNIIIINKDGEDTRLYISEKIPTLKDIIQ